MKKLFLLAIIIAGLGIFYACEKSEELIDHGVDDSISLKSGDISKKEEYDKNIKKFAKALSKALKDEEFRKYIKEEAENRVDGDFDILWKYFKSKPHPTNKKEIFNLLSENFGDGKNNDLESFSNEFMQLQISVPVGMENWDPVSFQPPVAFKTSSNYVGNNIIEAYDEQGKIIQFDATKVPNTPVIVVSLNERSDKEGNIETTYIKQRLKELRNDKSLKSASTKTVQDIYPFLIIEPGDDTPIPLPPSFTTGESTQVGVYLEWYYNSGYDYIDKIYILRNGQPITSMFVMDGTSSYVDNSTSLQPGVTYYYSGYIERENISTGEIVTGPISSTIGVTIGEFAPGPVTTFQCEGEASDQIQMYWTDNTNTQQTGYKLYRLPIDQSQTWQYIGSTDRYGRDFVDNANLTEGGKYRYKIVGYNDLGQSTPLYDVVYNPYRTAGQFLQIEEMELRNHHSYEQWTDGQPEFVLTVAMKESPSDDDPEIVSGREEVTINYESAYYSVDQTANKSTYKNMEFPLIINAWDQEFYKSVINVEVYEHDGAGWFAGDLNITFNLNEAIKVTDNSNISIQGAGEITLKTKEPDTDIGEGTIYYWHPTDYTINIAGDLFLKTKAVTP
ncbi:DUF3103 family protein [Draconibacterium sp. IB214405]|uniref:DUF3103 family protein n=1 Tax=Draconibacterium sp. IB214405 TaxID=3097352 RepID=UPI002A10FBE5|nr:DUF3103 family protein [Draconibacterium sp. IB214405]MDX8341711.1 DUF3103 family protein [Draconibacterium sp. IB214405]